MASSVAYIPLSAIRRTGESRKGPKPRPREELLTERIPYGSRLGFIITEKCNIRCSHCLPDCGPSRSEHLELAPLEQAIREAAAAGVETICFTGGEPFLRLPELKGLIALCNALGRQSTVMTNAFWATSEARARVILEKLSGLTRLGLSTDSFHQEFISVERIRHAIVAAHKLNIECAVRVCYLDDPSAEIQAIEEQLSEVKGRFIIEYQPVQPMGRAASHIDRDRIFKYDVGLAASCRSADGHAVNTNGDMTACCGATSYWPAGNPLHFGNIHHSSVGELLDAADKNPVLHAVRLWGPIGLLRLAQAQAEREGCSFTPPPMIDMCSLCEYVVADPHRAAMLKRSVANADVLREIAVARALKFGEISMLSELEVVADGSAQSVAGPL